MSVSVAQLSAEHHHDGFGISHRSPRLSWRFAATTVQGWRQASYDLVISRGGKDEEYHVDSSESVLVPWPSEPLSSREAVEVKVRAVGRDGLSTPWESLALEAALLERSDWKASLISGPPQSNDEPKRPFRLVKAFVCKAPFTAARLYATAHGMYQVEINGRRVGDHVLAPGWQSYKHRLHYQTYDITRLLKEGDNVIGVDVGEGWYAGRLGRPGVSNIWGDRLGFLCQLEVDRRDVVCVTDGSWQYLSGPILASEIYDGEVFDSTLAHSSWSTAPQLSSTEGDSPAEVLPFPSASIIAPDVAPVRRVLEVTPIEIIVTPKGKKVLDFGQNLVGWLRIETDIPGAEGDELVIRHAEVMEHGELGTRPLRTAKARDVVKLGGSTKGFEPSFTFHGFRYAEINGHDPKLGDFTAVAISTDLRRTGAFESSHALVNRLHENTVWSMRGNFVSVPTDCPQRDERLGWTGDIQVFSPTANYLFDTAAFLGSWLRDLEADQRETDTGVVPIVVPAIPMPPRHVQNRPMAVWADCSIITPWDLYTSFGDARALEQQWESMCLWLDRGVPRDEVSGSLLYSAKTPQYGDWLDPRSPPARPGHCPTDSFLVANAYLIQVTGLVARIAHVLGRTEAAERYSRAAQEALGLFQAEYMSPNARLVSDTQTAYALSLKFGLFREEHVERARARLDWLTRWEDFKITTGFAGTPLILEVLADHGLLNLAYRMLQEGDDPSWLYPVRMGATTIWERWNSMLPDGTINPGQMTSFNHYALGSVCAFLHSVVGGLSPTGPGWRSALVRPRPGGTIDSASTSFDSPYGQYAVRWRREGSKMVTQVGVPPNGEARVVLPHSDVDTTVGSGEYTFETDWVEDADWPPANIPGPQATEMSGRLVP